LCVVSQIKYAFDATNYIPFFSKITKTALHQMFILPLDNHSTVTKAKKDDLTYMGNEVIISTTVFMLKTRTKILKILMTQHISF